MAKLYKDGEVIEVVLTEDTTVDAIVPLKNRCGVALHNGLAGDTIAVAIAKTYHEVAKSDDVIELGDLLYWDGEQITKTKGTNAYIGFALEAKASGINEILFKLNG
jgi:predicted RecA/RadA family phage recombinase